MEVVVITGASSGVGRAVARAFGRAGARVGLIARGIDGLEAAAREVREAGGEAVVLPLDVADEGSVEQAADDVVARWGRIDVWINNAMVAVFSPAIEMHADEYRRVTEVNYLGYVHGTLAALRHMQPMDRGVIVQVGSALSYRSIPLQSAYCASKAAIRAFTDSVRSELIHHRSAVKITMVQLPAVNTPQFDVARSRLDGHPRPVPPAYQPEVVADAIVHAARHPRRERWVGWSSVQAILGQRVIPGVLDRYLASRAWHGQVATELPHGHPREHHADNLEAALPGDRGAHGPFDAQARSTSFQWWLRTNAGWIAAAGTAALALVAVPVWLAIRR